LEFSQVRHQGTARLPFAAELRATDLDSGQEIWGETTNLSRGGCHVRTHQAFPEGTVVAIEITHRRAHFVTDARVAYSLESGGMGLSFLNVPEDKLAILEDWISSIVAELSS
jgi:PilZ domain